MVKRFICASCRKKRNENFLGVVARLLDQPSIKICVDCWEKRFDHDKSKLVGISFNYENIILNKHECPPGKTLKE